MYIPKSFEVVDREVLRQFVKLNPLATLCVCDDQGLSADHVPMILREPPEVLSVQPWGSLVGHIALANPLARKAERR